MSAKYDADASGKPSIYPVKPTSTAVSGVISLLSLSKDLEMRSVAKMVAIAIQRLLSAK